MSRAELHLVESGPLPYLLSIPAGDAPESGVWPLLCFLHGYDEGAPMPIRRALTLHGPLRPESSPTATTSFVVVAPQMRTRGDLWYRDADAVQDLVREVQALHHGNPDQTYLTGFSFGGNGVFDLALEQREFWAALWAVDPTRVPREDPGLPVWLSSGEVSRRGEHSFVRRLHLQSLQNGTPGDHVYVDQGADHVGTAALAYEDNRIYRWLLSKHLRQDVRARGT